MSENITKPTNAPVNDYIASIENVERQSDARQMLTIMQEATGERPVMWGSSIVGFGSYHYKYASGREGDAVRVGFSGRKQALTIYGVIFYNVSEEENVRLLSKLGPHKVGKGCLYIQSLADIDLEVLKQMIRRAYFKSNDE